jgi:hypothetical protein
MADEGGGTSEAPKGSNKHVKVIALVAVLAVVIILIVFLLMNSEDILSSITTEPTPTTPEPKMIRVGDPQSTAIIGMDDASSAAMEEFDSGDEIIYVFCEELDSGDKIATMGDDPKYDVGGPVWFAFVDEEPYSFYGHDVKYVFIDAASGEKTVYNEEWSPDINGEDMFIAAEDCGGVTEIYAT